MLCSRAFLLFRISCDFDCISLLCLSAGCYAAIYLLKYLFLFFASSSRAMDIWLFASYVAYSAFSNLDVDTISRGNHKRCVKRLTANGTRRVLFGVSGIWCNAQIEYTIRNVLCLCIGCLSILYVPRCASLCTILRFSLASPSNVIIRVCERGIMDNNLAVSMRCHPNFIRNWLIVPVNTNW